MIHICFGLHDASGRYSKFTGTAMLSILENLLAPPQCVTIHILHDKTLTADNRDKFIYVAGKYEQLVKFYNVEELCADKLAEIFAAFQKADKVRYTIAAYYRLLIPYVLPAEIDKAIYLDSDIIVNLDIREFWNYELADKILGVVASGGSSNWRIISEGFVRQEDYFNSGILLMNLRLLRNEWQTLLKAMEFASQNPDIITFVDQGLLNYCFSTRTLKLPNKFGRSVAPLRKLNKPFDERIICHYVGMLMFNRLGFDMSDPFNRLWMDYFIKTPWFNSETIGRMYASISDSARRMHVAFKNAMTTIADFTSGKTRVFLILADYLEFITKTFTLRDDEEVIFIEHGAPLKKIAELMNSSRDKKIFFVMFPNFPFDAFIKAGFVYGRDFINAFEFLPDTNRDMFKSGEILKVM